MSDCEFKSLIPHVTPVELALETEANIKYCRNNPEIIKKLNDPYECPLEFLPWLAYSLSVDVWNDKWPEATKRAVCANSVQLHKLKGTRAGLEDALAVLGVRAEIVEWWEAEPKAERGTMALTLWVNEPLIPDAAVLIGEEMVADVRRQIDASKRASIHYEFILAVETTTGFSVAYSGGESAQLTRASVVNNQVEINAGRAGFAMVSSAECSLMSKATLISNQVKIKAGEAMLALASSVEMRLMVRVECVL